MYVCMYVDFMDEEEEEDLAERLSVEMLPLHGRDRWTTYIHTYILILLMYVCIHAITP